MKNIQCILYNFKKDHNLKKKVSKNKISINKAYLKSNTEDYSL